MAAKILVVDDELHVRGVLSEFLTEEGYEVIVATNGEEAIELAETESPQVILLDIKMPGIDGIEVCNTLKARERTRSIPIIIVTSYADRDVEAYLEGADDFVTKPFHPTEVSLRVKAALRIRHLTNELERAVTYIQELGKNLREQ